MEFKDCKMEALQTRAKGCCELCGGKSNLRAVNVDEDGVGELEKSVLLCELCAPVVASNDALDGGHWYCLQESMWSEVAAVQVLSYRLLHRMADAALASELIDQLYLSDEVLSWARRGLTAVDEAGIPQPVDSNGTLLSNGDTVTLIKNLDVKGANFTAKRGTVVKNIRVGDDPTHIEGKVNQMSIMLKTCFLKRVN